MTDRERLVAFLAGAPESMHESGYRARIRSGRYNKHGRFEGLTFGRGDLDNAFGESESTEYKVELIDRTGRVESFNLADLIALARR